MSLNKLHVHKNDHVVVISGKDKGKKGKILAAMPADGKVVVEGVNITVKHRKPKNAQQQGGRIEKESPIFASKVMLVCGKCGKATRIAHKIESDGSKARVCKHCGEQINK